MIYDRIYDRIHDRWCWLRVLTAAAEPSAARALFSLPHLLLVGAGTRVAIGWPAEHRVRLRWGRRSH